MVAIGVGSIAMVGITMVAISIVAITVGRVCMAIRRVSISYSSRLSISRSLAKVMSVVAMTVSMTIVSKTIAMPVVSMPISRISCDSSDQAQSNNSNGLHLY